MRETQHIKKIMDKIAPIAGDDLYWHKVADAGSLEYSQPRAVDVLASYRGKFIGMEWKLHKTKGAFALKRFRQHQYDELKRIEKSGGRALIVIGVYVDNGKFQEIYIVPYQKWSSDVIACFQGVSDSRKSVNFGSSYFSPYRLKLSKVIDCQTATTILNRIVGIAE